jgi:hypothetical protein
MTEAQHYALALLAGEMGEALDPIGNALRFGLDSPQWPHGTIPASVPNSPRALLNLELGDVLAAIEYAIQRDLVERDLVYHQRDVKLMKLLDPDSRDNLGRRLAP